MVSRGVAKVLVVVGALLLVVGLILVVNTTLPSGADESVIIDPGWQNIAYFSWSVLSGGHVEGSFSEANGTPVTLLVLNSTDYNAYLNGKNLTGLYQATAANGSVSLDVSGWDTFYVVLQHAAGYENASVDVTIALTMSGLDPTSIIGGFALLAVGAVLVAFGVRRLRAKEPAPPPFPVGASPSFGFPRDDPQGPTLPTPTDGSFRVPPPLPGTPQAAAVAPAGTIELSVENRTAADEVVQVLLDGTQQANLMVPAGKATQASLPARLTSPFGSTVRVEVVTSAGRRARQDVFVGPGGTAAVALRVG